MNDFKVNPANERIKRTYFDWQKEANGKSDSTLNNIRKAIDRYEEYTGYADFKTYHLEKAKGFKKKLCESKSFQANEPLSMTTISSILRHLKDFFKWLAYQRGCRHIEINHIEYFNLSGNEVRSLKSPKVKKYPTLEQIRKVVECMSDKNDIEKRNRALIAFTITTGMRDRAISSLHLKHIDIEKELVEQLGSEVKTKFGKNIFTFFFPVGDFFEDIVKDWIKYMYEVKLFNSNDPAFPHTKMTLDKNNSFIADGIEPVFWQTAEPIRQIFREAFKKAGIEYFPPHSFRTTLGVLGEQVCKTPEEFKAWSQNLGHESPLTTFTSYGEVSKYKQGEIIKGLSINSLAKDKSKSLRLINPIIRP